MLSFLAVSLLAPQFKDVTAEVGLQINTDAACWVDINADGWSDIVAGGFAWLNDKGKSFSKIAQVGSVVAADFDNDGFPDLYSWSHGALFRNLKGKEFELVELPDELETLSRGACWGDWNRDGFVDLYVGGYENWETQKTFPSMILLNQKGKSFRAARKESSFRTRGVSACDYDADGDLDIYTSNYRLQPNQLWQNDGKGNFTDVATKANVLATSPGFKGGHSIGAAWGDFNNDGLFDLFAGNFAHVDNRGDQPKSRMYLNLGAYKQFAFEDKGTWGVHYQESYATPAAGDYDNDGRLDLMFTTVYATASFKRPNFPALFRNASERGFVDETQKAGVASLPPTYQAAWADFNNDGRLDLISGGKLFRNEGPSKNWLLVKIKGNGKTRDSSAIGTQVRIKIGKTMITRQVEAGTGEGNQNDLRLHFGLGDHDKPVDVEVKWLDGRITRQRNVRPNTSISITG